VFFATATVFVALGFVLFALDESDKGSREQISKVDDAMNAPDPTSREELVRERKHGTVREAIDDVNDALLKPFAPLVDDATSTWKRRTIPTILALVLYGLIGLLLANFLPKPKTKQRDWRQATG
jgi:hypothetical protein